MERREPRGRVLFSGHEPGSPCTLHGAPQAPCASVESGPIGGRSGEGHPRRRARDSSRQGGDVRGSRGAGRHPFGPSRGRSGHAELPREASLAARAREEGRAPRTDQHRRPRARGAAACSPRVGGGGVRCERLYLAQAVRLASAHRRASPFEETSGQGSASEENVGAVSAQSSTNRPKAVISLSSSSTKVPLKSPQGYRARGSPTL